MNGKRWDETWHRLREWTNGQTQSERLAAQVLLGEGFTNLDPSHPLGGKDGGKDGTCKKKDKKWVMAVYFPRGKQSFAKIKKKFVDDLKGVRANLADGIAFVTNQEISLAQRRSLTDLASPELADLFHLERLTAILDQPEMAATRKQFLAIDSDDTATVLGGEGGKALGSGGGGGAAVGFGARGGDGGAGGNIQSRGRDGKALGAGGGGAGVIGEFAVGGGGGEGGEIVMVEILPDELQELRNLGLDRVSYRVGRGGEDNVGQENGEDTVIDFLRADGKILKSITAKGGKGGKRGGSK
jgi:hypothetical protein